MAGARPASRPNSGALLSVPGETPRIPPQPRMPRAGHRDRSTASINHRHRKIPPAFASNHLRSIRHYGIRMESERRRIGEVLRSIQLAAQFAKPPNQDAFELESGFTLGSASNGINPPAEPVILQIGTFATTIPPGSFTKIPGAFGMFTFAGVIDGVTLHMLIIYPTGTKRYAL